MQNIIISQIGAGNSLLKQIQIKCIITQEQKEQIELDEIEIQVSNIIAFDQFLEQSLQKYSQKQQIPIPLLKQLNITCFFKQIQVDIEEKKSLLELGIENNSMVTIKIGNSQPSTGSLIQIEQNQLKKLSLADQYTVNLLQSQNSLIKQQTNKQNQIFDQRDQRQQNIEEVEKLITISNFNKQSLNNANNKFNQIINSHKYQIIGNAINRTIAEKSQYNRLQDPRDYKVSQKIDENSLELLLYVLSDQLEQSNIKLYHTKEIDELSMYSLQTSFAKDCSQAQCLKLKLQESPNLQFDDLSNNQLLGDRFTQDIKEIISKSYQVHNDSVDILGIEKGSIVVNFKVNEIKDDLTSSEITLAEVNKKYPQSKPTLQLHPFIKQMILSPNDFDPKGNMEWKKDHKEWEERGPRGDKMKYWFPRGWSGFGLNVKNKYDDGNQDWLLMNGNPNEWHIMFHGTSSLACKGIIQDGFKIGNGQQYKDKFCMRTQQIIGEGIYFSNHVEVCQDYSRQKGTKILDKEYYVVFQSRVKPSALKQVKKKSDVKGKGGNPDWDNDYFLVNKVEDIRPYRILLLKMEK